MPPGGITILLFVVGTIVGMIVGVDVEGDGEPVGIMTWDPLHDWLMMFCTTTEGFLRSATWKDVAEIGSDASLSKFETSTLGPTPTVKMVAFRSFLRRLASMIDLSLSLL